MRTVLCRLPHGAVLEVDGQTVLLDHGINDNAPVELVERWLARNARLACVRDGLVTIAEDARADRVVISNGNNRLRKQHEFHRHRTAASR